MKMARKKTGVLHNQSMVPNQQFLGLQALSGIVLVAFSLAALLLANSGYSSWYENIWTTKIAFAFGGIKMDHSIQHWINDGLMAVFFFVIGLEIKREILMGELSSREKLTLPIVAALGGAVLPAVVYAFFNVGSPGAGGWGVPMATDIAFVLGTITLLGKRVPGSIKIFVMAFAIIDDLIAILVIAIFYSDGINLVALGIGISMVAFSWIIKNKGGYNPFLFAGIGTLSWYAFSISGIHPTIAGVLMAITIPATKKVRSENQQKTQKKSPLDRLEQTLHPISSFIIMPVFAFANAGIKIESDMLSTLSDPITLGIILGLWVGKPLGVFGSIWIAIKLKAVGLPTGSSWKHIVGMSFLGGMGFTLSLFIAVLAFEDVVLLNHAKTGILLGSIISVLSGILFFLKADPVKEATGSFK